jgi:predicted PurR-regulated permease PerM
MYEIVSASKTLNMDFGGIQTGLTFEVPKDINFNNQNINDELRNITEYINNDINNYLSCLSTKSEAEIISSLEHSGSHFTELINLIPKINSLIPNIEKLKTFLPENQDINRSINGVIDSLKVIDKYASILITLLLIILSTLLLILSISTLIFISLFVEQISSKHMIAIIIVYVIITLIISYFVKNYIEEELNKSVTQKLNHVKSDINNIINLIKSNI